MDDLDQIADRADEIYDAMQEVCKGRAAADVVYALGMMIAHAVQNSTQPENIDLTFELLRNVVGIELER